MRGMRSAPGHANRRAPAERRSKQLVDFPSRNGGGQAVVELDLDESQEERIERATGGEELLGDLGKRAAGGDHASERRNLAAGTVDVSNGRIPVRCAKAAHGDTNAAPVIPDAAWPGSVHMNVCVPG